jgi:tRNA threonylcarbamoyladenosine biosynthesis protein TsaE
MNRRHKLGNLAILGDSVTPILTDQALETISHSATQTLRIGKLLGELLRPGDVVCLQGDLGSGKTCLTQGIGLGLHVAGTISSPTFVFISEHAPSGVGPYLYHADLYRIEEPNAVFSLGLEDYMYGDGVTVIEWAERAAEFVPSERLWITLTYVDYTKRSLRFEACGQHYVEILAAFKAQLFKRGPRPAASEEE